MSIERELMRGAGPVAVLKLLERGEMYGYELVEALSQRTDGLLEMGQSTLYPMLYNLEAKGLIEARWVDDAPRRRKYYRLTADGTARLAADSARWNTMVSAMQAIGVVHALLGRRLTGLARRDGSAVDAGRAEGTVAA